MQTGLKDERSVAVLRVFAAMAMALTTSLSAGGQETSKADWVRAGASRAVVAAGNGIYQVFVETDPFNGNCGRWTALTGAAHPAGPDLNVLFGGGLPGTSNTTLRSYNSGMDYVTGAWFGDDCTSICVAAMGAEVTPIQTAGIIVGYRMTWTILDGANVIGFTQEVVVEGPVDGTETVDNTVIRETHTVANAGPENLSYGLRKHWDWQIGADDGPWFGDCRTPDEACDRSMNLTGDGGLDGCYPQSYVINDDPGAAACPGGLVPNEPAGCGGNPLYVVAGTVRPPAVLAPPPNPPELLQFNAWPALSSTCWQPALLDAALCGALGFPSDDTATAYFYGLTPASAETLGPGEQKSFTQYVVAGEDTCPQVVAPPEGRADISHKGSLLVYPKIELKWNALGGVVQDTFVSITNDYPDDVFVHWYFVNGDPPVEPIMAGDPPMPVEPAHPGWNWVNCTTMLTGDEPTYFSALTGSGSCQAFTTLDNVGGLMGRLDPEANDGSRVLRGYAIVYAVDRFGNEISWNHLSGAATLVHYADQAAWEYNAFAFQATAPQYAETDAMPGKLDLDGLEYDVVFDKLLLDFFAVGSQILTGRCRSVMLDTDLTLLPMLIDVRQDSEGPVITKAHFDIWNQNEDGFSGTTRCITCWDQTLLSAYELPNHFMMSVIHTDKGKARVDGVRSDMCDLGPCGGSPDRGTYPWCSQDAPLLGVSAKVLAFSGLKVARTYAGMTLVGQGTEAGRILADVVEPPGTLTGPEGEPRTRAPTRIPGQIIRR